MAFDEYLDDDPLWYKDAIIYEVHVKAYCDSAGDGIGDFKGLTSKLDYLKDLGISAVWLLPFYPSPLKDDGYDIADYFDIHPLYGALRDFKEFMREAHKRGIRVITELVLNHTSDQHPWFSKSRTAEPGSKWREFYVWSNTPEKYKEARIIFKDFETSNWTWDNTAKAYYWHRFYSHQPELNFENSFTQKTMLSVVEHWLKMGVDGLRLDAVPYLYEKDGTNCENLPETHAYLKRLRSFVDASFKNKMLLAEANQWPSDAAQYFGNGDECNMVFHFPLMPRMFMAIQMEDRFPIVDILEQTPTIPEPCQWALFLRNHDELTLEMVTDEERDYMYRVYAKDRESKLNLGIRRRLAPLLGNDRRKIELMNILLFTLPGTPVIYYGDEIGMGDNFYLGDRNGVRTPMQWSGDLNAGFSKTNPQKLYMPVIIEPHYHYEAINVENQQSDPSSLLWWMKKLVAVRKRFKAFGRGAIEFLYPSNSKIISYLRKYDDEILFVAANLSGRTQAADFDLAQFDEFHPSDVLGGGVFPQVGKSSYRLTFAPYGYYVFSLVKQQKAPDLSRTREIREIAVQKRIHNLFNGKAKDDLESLVLEEYLKTSRWFGGKNRRIDQIRIRDAIPFDTNPDSSSTFFFLILDVYYDEGLPESYFVPVCYSNAEIFEQIKEKSPSSIIGRVRIDKNSPGVLYDALFDEGFRWKLLQLILQSRQARGEQGEVYGRTLANHTLLGFSDAQTKSSIIQSEQSNTSLVFQDKCILKLIRRIEEGKNPELEIAEFLPKHGFDASPKIFGSLFYHAPGAESNTVAVLEEYVRNEGTAWNLFSEEFRKFQERMNAKKTTQEVPDSTTNSPAIEKRPVGSLEETIGQTFNNNVSLLGKRTGQFHLALMRETDDRDFRPEPFGYLEQVAMSQSMISYSNRVFERCAMASGLSEEVKKELDSLIQRRNEITSRFLALRQIKLDCMRSRNHGDYHLGQVLFTGKDFTIIDFEGEPTRSLSERHLKRTPLKDVAGMLRSFQYVAYSSIISDSTTRPKEDVGSSIVRAKMWISAVSDIFLKSYLETVDGSAIIPKDKNAFAILLDAYLLEKSIYELAYELDNRPSWLLIPIRGITGLIGSPSRPLESQKVVQ
ncbi:MAG: maltose alpha-D-glucosyltransferase [Nitrososphaerales archaeon]